MKELTSSKHVNAKKYFSHLQRKKEHRSSQIISIDEIMKHSYTLTNFLILIGIIITFCLLDEEVLISFQLERHLEKELRFR